MSDTSATPVRRLLTIAEAADELRISRPTPYRLARTGEWPSVCIGGSVRVPTRQLVDTLARSQVRMRRTPDADLPEMRALLRKGCAPEQAVAILA